MSEKAACLRWGNRWEQHNKTLMERFTEKWELNPETGCWEWQARRKEGRTYGYLGVDGKPRHAHRLAYELHVGPIPEGLVIDHLCNVPCCVNPDHLQAVTPEENRRRQVERKTHCVHNDPLSGENLVLVRRCRICLTAAEDRHQKRKRERKRRAA